MGIKKGGKHRISKDLLYTPTLKGGLGIIRLEDFVRAIKCSWVKRFCIDKLDDHWADLLDTHFNTSPNTRHTILKFGPERFNKLISKKIPGLSSIFLSYKTLSNNFQLVRAHLIIAGYASQFSSTQTLHANYPTPNKLRILHRPSMDYLTRHTHSHCLNFSQAEGLLKGKT